MSSPIGSVSRWLKQLPIPTGRQFWQEQIGLAVLVAGVVGMIWKGRILPVYAQAILWAVLGVAAAVLMRRGWVKLFGPVLFYDLLRVGRRSRYIFFRTLYVCFLFVLLGWVYLMWYESNALGRTSPGQAAEFAESFFFTLMTVQLLVILILTPAYLAGAIAEEKDRKTLEFLLATDLQSREIVLSKLLSRLANMTLIVLAALPVLSATQFFGGIDPDLLLASFAALGLTMMSLAAISILMSVHSRRPRDAIVLTYLFIVIYPTLSFLALGLVSVWPWVGTLGVPMPGSEGVWWLDVNDLVGAYNAGNLFWVLFELGRTLDSGKPLADVLPELLRNYAIFHGCVTLLCTTWAVVRLRPVALKEAFGKTRKGSLGLRLFGRPPVGTQPMLWKEIFAEARLNFHWLGRIAVAVLVIVSFVPVVIIFYEFLDRYSGWNAGMGYRYDFLGTSMNVWLRIVGTIVMVLMLLAVAVRASGSVSGERDRQTLDGLLTTPMESNTILLAKWLGAILSVRWAWLWIGMIWMLGVVTGGVKIFALPPLAASWLVYAGVFACIGLWFSVTSRTTLRSTLGTLLTVLFVGGGHWLVMGMCCFLPLGLAGVRERDFEYLLKFEWGQTPPLVMGLLAVHGEEFDGSRSSTEMLELMGFSLFGLGCWTVAGLVLANFVMERFRRITNRQPVQRRQFRPPGPRPAPAITPPRSEIEDVPLLVQADEASGEKKD